MSAAFPVADRPDAAIRGAGRGRLIRGFSILVVAALSLALAGPASASSSGPRGGHLTWTPLSGPRADGAAGEPGETIEVRRDQLHSARSNPLRLAAGASVLSAGRLTALRSAGCLASASGGAGRACSVYRLSFDRSAGLGRLHRGSLVLAGSSARLPDAILMQVTRVRRTADDGWLIVGTPAMIDRAIRGRWNFRVPIRVTAALLRHARAARGVSFSLRPFARQRPLLSRRDPTARAADVPIVGPQPEGFYVELNNFDLGALPGSGGRFHILVTGYAKVNLFGNIGTDPSRCPDNSCPGTAWHVETGFGMDLQKVQFSLGYGQQKIRARQWVPSPQDVQSLKSALASQPLISLPWGYVPFPNITFMLPIGPVPVPVVITQNLTLSTDISVRALFGLQASVDVGFNVGAGFAWASGTHFLDPGHLEAISYHDAHASWGSDASDSQSLVQDLLGKLTDPHDTAWLLGAGLKIVPWNMRFNEKLYGFVGAQLELHLPYVNFQASWNVNRCTISAAGTWGLEGQLNAIVTIGPLNQTFRLPIQFGWAGQLFSATFPFLGLGCGSPGSPLPSSPTPTPVSPPTPTPTPGPSPGPGGPPGSSGQTVYIGLADHYGAGGPAAEIGPGWTLTTCVYNGWDGVRTVGGPGSWSSAPDSSEAWIYGQSANSTTIWWTAGTGILTPGAGYDIYADVDNCNAGTTSAWYTIAGDDGAAGFGPGDSGQHNVEIDQRTTDVLPGAPDRYVYLGRESAGSRGITVALVNGGADHQVGAADIKLVRVS